MGLATRPVARQATAGGPAASKRPCAPAVRQPWIDRRARVRARDSNPEQQAGAPSSSGREDASSGPSAAAVADLGGDSAEAAAATRLKVRVLPVPRCRAESVAPAPPEIPRGVLPPAGPPSPVHHARAPGDERAAARSGVAGSRRERPVGPRVPRRARSPGPPDLGGVSPPGTPAPRPPPPPARSLTREPRRPSRRRSSWRTWGTGSSTW